MTCSLLSFNVLKYFTNDQTRYANQLKRILQLQIDILCFMEVTKEYRKFVLDSPQIAQKYKKGIEYQLSNRKICVQIMSKFDILPLYNCKNISISLIRNVIIVVCHLDHLESKSSKRRLQLIQLINILDNLGNNEQKQVRQAIQKKRIIICGDFNYHMKDQTLHIYQQKYIDIWLHLNSQQPGYTWDSLHNSLIQYLIFDNRRMRLDRIIIPEQSSILPKRIDLVMTQKIKKLNYSDHFGLVLEFEVGDQLIQRKVQRQVLEIQGVHQTGFRKFNRIVLLRYMTIIVFSLWILLLMNLVYCMI